jgi:hypothetical protein
MPQDFEIENIEEMRRAEGIDDVALREEVRRLKVGDFVNLTLLVPSKAFAGETLVVRITSIRGGSFRGKLAERSAPRGVAGLKVGTALVFTAGHIHSVVKSRSRVTVQDD